MTTQNNPAFPYTEANGANSGDVGMTLRQYAAIKLKVPDAGEEWLDDMIRKSLLNDFAGQAMQGIVSHDPTFAPQLIHLAAKDAHSFATAMLAAKDTK